MPPGSNLPRTTPSNLRIVGTTLRRRAAVVAAVLAPALAAVPEGRALGQRAPGASTVQADPSGAEPSGAEPSGAEPSGAARIRLNQLGFYPAGPKAAVVADTAATRFAVLTADRGDTVFAGPLAPARHWAPSAESVRMATFDGLTRPGRYVLAVPGVGRSHPFVVGDTVLWALARAAVKAFYFQRASTALPARYAGPWSRPAGHPDTAVLVHPSAAGPGRPAGAHLSAPRGWYDAGDYNKYRVTLRPGETRTVALPLPAASLAYWDAGAHRWTLEREPVRLEVGASSADVRLARTVHLLPAPTAR